MESDALPAFAFWMQKLREGVMAPEFVKEVALPFTVRMLSESKDAAILAAARDFVGAAAETPAIDAAMTDEAVVPLLVLALQRVVEKPALAVDMYHSLAGQPVLGDPRVVAALATLCTTLYTNQHHATVVAALADGIMRAPSPGMHIGCVPLLLAAQDLEPVLPAIARIAQALPHFVVQALADSRRVAPVIAASPSEAARTLRAAILRYGDDCPLKAEIQAQPQIKSEVSTN